MDSAWSCQVCAYLVRQFFFCCFLLLCRLTASPPSTVGTVTNLQTGQNKNQTEREILDRGEDSGIRNMRPEREILKKEKIQKFKKYGTAYKKFTTLELLKNQSRQMWKNKRKARKQTKQNRQQNRLRDATALYDLVKRRDGALSNGAMKMQATGRAR